MIDRGATPIMISMERYPDIPRQYPTLSDRVSDAWDRGLRVAKRMAIAFGLSTALAIGVGAAVTDNAFSQIIVTILGAVGFWIPMLFVTVGIERFFARRAAKPRSIDEAASVPRSSTSWQRLAAAAPGQQERLLVLRRSLDASHRSFRSASLDPDAHDLCLLIERRLPELIDHELDSLPPDDRGRRRQIDELVDLVEQFARHCGRKRDGDRSASAYQAEIIRRRFADRLSGAGSLDQ